MLPFGHEIAQDKGVDESEREDTRDTCKAVPDGAERLVLAIREREI